MLWKPLVVAKLNKALQYVKIRFMLQVEQLGGKTPPTGGAAASLFCCVGVLWMLLIKFRTVSSDKDMSSSYIQSC